VTSDEVVVGVDLGTTSTKAVAFDTGGRQLATASAGYPLAEPHPGWAEQDPAQILDAVLHTVSAVVSEVDGPVAALSFSSAMHTLMGLDATGAPLTPSLSWADSRAAAQADRLRAAPGGLALHRRTGTPVHPMAPLPKLVWFREERPELFDRVACWAGIKDYVLSRMCGALVTDQSVASGTGLLDLGTLSWDREALQLAGIGPERLPRLVPTTTVLSGLSAAVADRLGLPAGTPMVAGAGDGPLANLGLGAVHPGVAACSIGTSGALRVMVESPAVDPQRRVFCYALVPGHWIVGGAINNGGAVLRWAGEALAPDLGSHPEAQLLELAAKVPPGSEGLLMLPYLLSERAPHWSSVARGAYVGLTRHHGRGHLVRAALEGVCLQLALVLASVREAGNEVREMRATGGFARSALWRQMLADALGMPIGFAAGHEGSAFGAALLAMDALGLVDGIDRAAQLVQIEDVIEPEPQAAGVYADLLPTFASLYDALTPAFRALERHR
jgi:gluconokinase